jgi:pSer/pThr/pTyr-binding forkhead associated (FHA) protein
MAAPAGTRSVTELKARIDAERAGQPFLLYLGGDGRQQLFHFESDMAQVSVGRRESADVVLDWDEEVSRLHARFERIQDGRRLSGRRRLSNGDSVRFGSTTLTFRSSGVDEQATAVAREMPELSISATQRRVLVALCRPYKHGGSFASPSTNQQIAEELFLSVAAVKTHLRTLFAKFCIEHLPQNQKRIGLVERAFYSGLVSERDL